MSTARVRAELGWRPPVDAVDALRELIDGMAHRAHTDSPPLSADRMQPGRPGGLLRGRLPGHRQPVLSRRRRGRKCRTPAIGSWHDGDR